MGVQWERSRWEAVLEKVTRSQVGAVPVEGGPPLGPVLVGSGPWWWPTFRVFFCRLPTLISYVSNLMWVFRGVVLVFWAFSFEKTLTAVRGVTQCPESPDVCFLPVRGSVLPEV